MKSAWIGIVGIVIGTGAAVAAAQDPLSNARELYASAAYEDALSTLTRVTTGDPAPAVAEQADEYRAFCLFALGRVNEAQQVAENLISRNPLLELNATDASPRITAMFSDVRKKLLPGLIRDQYRAARAAMDNKDFAAAEPKLKLVHKMIEEADRLHASDETLGDLRVLADGFLELAKAAHASTPASAPQNSAAPAASPAAVAAAPPPPREGGTAAPVVKTPARIYDSNTADVVPPQTLRQVFPAVPPQLANLMSVANTKAGLLDIVVDENGDVEKAVVRESINPIYDRLVVQAAKTWKYRPATRGGAAVKYYKSIAINLK